MYVITPDQVRAYSAHVCTYDHKNNQSNNTNWLRAFALSQIIHALVSTSTHHSQDNWTSALYVLTGVGTQVRPMIGGIKNVCRKNAYSVIGLTVGIYFGNLEFQLYCVKNHASTWKWMTYIFSTGGSEYVWVLHKCKETPLTECAFPFSSAILWSCAILSDR